MKKYLSKKYIKYIGSLCAVWAALWNVFLLGVSLENSGPAADSTLLQCILGSENYAHDFFTRQFWFISVFVFYMAVYFVVFLFLQHESGKYRRNLVWTDFINEAQQNIGIYTDNAG